MTAQEILDNLREMDKRDSLLANDAASKIRELIKENERMASDREVLLSAMEELARLGNEPHYGNSNGNMIARAAIQKVTK